MPRRARSVVYPHLNRPPTSPLRRPHPLLPPPQVRRARLGIASVLQRGIAGITAEDLKNKRTETNQRRTNLREAQIRYFFVAHALICAEMRAFLSGIDFYCLGRHRILNHLLFVPRI